jgi:hypothetical protein
MVYGAKGSDFDPLFLTSIGQGTEFENGGLGRLLGLFYLTLCLHFPCQVFKPLFGLFETILQ